MNIGLGVGALVLAGGAIFVFRAAAEDLRKSADFRLSRPKLAAFLALGAGSMAAAGVAGGGLGGAGGAIAGAFVAGGAVGAGALLAVPDDEKPKELPGAPPEGASVGPRVGRRYAFV